MYDDYDSYASDSYQSEEDGWSPGEYFSPEGIKGRWAGEQPDGRAGGRGRPGSDAAADRDPFDTAFESTGRGRSDPRGGYGADDYASGAYDLPEGADSPERGRRRRRDREDRGERTGILPRLRRDRGEDIWPDDGISDEDYWASVAADRPLNGPDSPLDDERGPAGGAPRRTAPSRPGDQRGDLRGGDQRGGDQRGVTGRLGPPPGLTGDYKPGSMIGSGPMPRAGQPGGRASGGQLAIGQPGGSRTSGPMPRAGQPGGGGRLSGGQLAIGQPGSGSRTSSGPMPTRPGTGPVPVRSATGPTPARSATGPTPSRPATGPTPTVGVTASRPPTGPNGMRPGPRTGPSPAWPGQAQQRPASASGGFPQSPPRPSFQPNGFQPGGGSAGRQYDRGDRTERIERVSAPGHSDQRPGGRRPSGPGPDGRSGAPGRGRDDTGGWRTPDRREADRREGGRDSGGWPVPSRGGVPAWGGANDDPLTSRAFSRSAISDTDGRSYRVAARRSQAQTMLTEQTETFITGQYQSGHTGDYPTATFPPAEQRTGEYRQYRGEAPGTAGQTATGRLPAYGSQDGRQASGHPSQPQSTRDIGDPAGSGSATSGWPAQPTMPGGQYDGQRQRQQQPQAQQPQQPQPQQPQAQQPQQPQAQQQQPQAQQAQQPQTRSQAQSPAPLPAMPLSAPVPSANGLATGSSPVTQPGGRGPAKGGLNPYDVAITGSYPYPGQTFPPALPGPSQSAQSQSAQSPSAQSPSAQSQSAQSQSAQSQSAQSQSAQSPSAQSQSAQSQSGVDDQYYRPLPADGYPSGGDMGRSNPVRAGYGASYGNGYQDPRDRRY